ncbi:MAG: hypothetical protein KDK39_11030 [Leptospiraceae bacterium]|nr:hypothetical protein [Leptospiraceae bacterium]
MSSEFEISKLLQVTSEGKYAATVAAFEVVDLIDQVKVPKEFLNRKPSIQALQILSEKSLTFDFISDESRQALREKLGIEDNPVYARPTANDVAGQIFADTEAPEMISDSRELNDSGFEDSEEDSDDDDALMDDDDSDTDDDYDSDDFNDSDDSDD